MYILLLQHEETKDIIFFQITETPFKFGYSRYCWQTSRRLEIKLCYCLYNLSSKDKFDSFRIAVLYTRPLEGYIFEMYICSHCNHYVEIRVQ